MSKIIKGFGFIIVLGGILFTIWSYMDKQNSVEIKPEKIMEKIVEKTDTQAILSKKATPIFNSVDSLARLDFYKMHAIATEKILMVYFYSNGCYYCEKMKNITFADSRVQKELEKDYIAVSVNYSKYKYIFKKVFHLHATPAIIFFNKEGQSIYEEPAYGYQGAEDFYNKIELLAEPF